jgi:hypothetical protein
LANIAEAIRMQCGMSKYVFKEEAVLENNVLNLENFEVQYTEYLDSSTSPSDYKGPGNTLQYNFQEYGFLPNNNGVIVPVLYKTWDIEEGAEEDYDLDKIEVFYYIGIGKPEDEPEFELCDKWKKIEVGANAECTWDSAEKQNIYTNIIIEEIGLTPLEFIPTVENKISAEATIISDIITEVNKITAADLTIREYNSTQIPKIYTNIQDLQSILTAL